MRANHAERYRAQAEQLNERERRNRTEGQSLDDFTVARISSFLKSYGEMRKGRAIRHGRRRMRAREPCPLCHAALALLAGQRCACASFLGGGWGREDEI